MQQQHGDDGTTAAVTGAAVDVATWNLLTPAYCSASHLPYNPPDSVDNEWRWSAVEKRLLGLFRKQTIVCLQEVSAEWAGRLQLVCADNNYEFVVRLYGAAHSGYMGVAIAYPRAKFVAECIDRIRPGDLVKWPEKPTSSSSSITSNDDNDDKYGRDENGHLSMSMYLGRHLWEWVTGAHARRLAQWQYMDNMKHKKNSVLRIRFRERNTKTQQQQQQQQPGGGSSRDDDTSFTVATYHMPCDFRHPDRMLLHAMMASNAVLHDLPLGDSNSNSSSSSRRHPVVFAGDFNILPGSLPYDWMTSQGPINGFHIRGEGGISDVQRGDKNPFYRLWKQVQRQAANHFNCWQSAYYEASGAERTTRQGSHDTAPKSEPACTIRTHSEFCQNTFEGTLDYVWVRNLRVESVGALSDTQDLLPSKLSDEPSDHMMLRATVRRMVPPPQAKD